MEIFLDEDLQNQAENELIPIVFEELKSILLAHNDDNNDPVETAFSTLNSTYTKSHLYRQ